MKQLLERFRNVSWLSEEENAELSINKLKIQLVEGDLDEVEPRAQDWLKTLQGARMEASPDASSEATQHPGEDG